MAATGTYTGSGNAAAIAADDGTTTVWAATLASTGHAKTG